MGLARETGAVCRWHTESCVVTEAVVDVACTAQLQHIELAQSALLTVQPLSSRIEMNSLTFSVDAAQGVT